MDISNIANILIQVVPSVSACLTILGCCMAIFIKFKKLVKRKDSEIETANQRLIKAYSDIAVLKSKITSIEKYLLDKKEGR